MKLYLTVIFAFMTMLASYGQDPVTIRTLDSLFSTSVLDSLEKVYGTKKSIPEEHKLEIFTALSFFPELESTRITFKKTKIKTTMNVRPTLSSMVFREKRNRNYVIRINNTKNAGKPLFADASFNAKVGILGHEFSHIVDYKKQNFLGMGKRAISYLFPKSKARYESEIDAYTIQKGIGWQLYDWKYFVHNDSMSSDKYKRFKERIYLMPDDIMLLINE